MILRNGKPVTRTLRILLALHRPIRRFEPLEHRTPNHYGRCLRGQFWNIPLRPEDYLSGPILFMDEIPEATEAK